MTIDLRHAVIAGVGLAVSAALVSADGAAAQDFPDKPITFVVPAGTGGSNDRAARLMSTYLSEELGVPVTVVNRPGGGNFLGHVYFRQQPADGYTILRTTAIPYMTVNQLVQGADFTIEDFAPINLTDIDTSIIATSTDSEFETIDDLVAEIRENPGTVSVGVQPTSADMINFGLFLDAMGLSEDDVRVVTYDSGNPVRTGIAGGQFDFGVIGERGLRRLAENVRPLMIFADERLDAWDAPTVLEVTEAAGVEEYPNILSGSVRGYFVHPELIAEHPERYQLLVETFEKISNDPEAIAEHGAQALTIEWYGPETSTEMMMKAHENLAKPEFMSVLKPE